MLPFIPVLCSVCLACDDVFFGHHRRVCLAGRCINRFQHGALADGNSCACCLGAVCLAWRCAIGGVVNGTVVTCRENHTLGFRIGAAFTDATGFAACSATPNCCLSQAMASSSVSHTFRVIQSPFSSGIALPDTFGVLNVRFSPWVS